MLFSKYQFVHLTLPVYVREWLTLQPWLNPSMCITVLPRHDAFLICPDLRTQLAQMSWLRHLWLNGCHSQTCIDGTGPTVLSVILSADGLEPPNSLLSVRGFFGKVNKIGNCLFHCLIWKCHFSSFYFICFIYLSFSPQSEAKNLWVCDVCLHWKGSKQEAGDINVTFCRKVLRLCLNQISSYQIKKNTA